MGTITVSLKDSVEQEFRSVAAETFGRGKGHLGRALAEALQNWVYEHKQERIAKQALRIMNMELHSGGWSYPHRSELHDR